MTGPHITEPMTMATDYVLAVLGAAFALSLGCRSRRSRHGSAGFWVAAFLVSAFAAAAGGTAHGFALYLGRARWEVVWEVTVWSIGLGAALMITAGVRSALRPESQAPEQKRRGVRWLQWAVAITIVGLLIMVMKLSLHEHLNQNDIYHVFQMAGFYFLYRGALALHGLER